MPEPPSGPGSPTPFDGQAPQFDRRVGLPEADCRAIAAAVLDLAQAGAGDRVLEIGAGTGLIGRWLLEPGVRYVGLDLSRGMLEVFRRRPEGARAGLVQADAARPWPLPAGSVRALFSSRAIHLLPLAHVVDEAFRVVARAPHPASGSADRGGGVCLLGWVERPPDSVKARLSREMQRLVRQRGFTPRAAGSHRFLAACRERGAAELPRTVVARLPVRHTARQSLDSWRSKPGLGGIVLPPGIQEAVLDELEAWAARTFGGLDDAWPAEEAYVLEGVRLPPLPAPADDRRTAGRTANQSRRPAPAASQGESATWKPRTTSC